jgi:hypothetical protein
MARHGNTRVVQDDKREEDMARIFGTHWNAHREAADSHTDDGVELEFKSHSKPSVSTARDLGYAWIERMSKRYWVLGRFINHDSGHVWQTFRFMAPCHLKGWFDKIRAKLDSDKKVSEQVVAILQAANADTSLIERAAKLMKDGALLNDPNIPAKYIEANSILITEDHPETLKKLIQEFPLDNTESSQNEEDDEHIHDDIFVFGDNEIDKFI